MTSELLNTQITIIHSGLPFTKIRGYPQLKFAVPEMFTQTTLSLFPLFNRLKQNTNSGNKPRFCSVLFYKGQNAVIQTPQLESYFCLFNTVIKFQILGTQSHRAKHN